MIARRCIVSGRVQGVFYRKSAQARARELGVRGHARNLDDGRVEVLAVGEAAPVAAFVAWLWEGSSASRVVAVEVEELAVAEFQRAEGFGTG
jgi:acylphosphatase